MMKLRDETEKQVWVDSVVALLRSGKVTPGTAVKDADTIVHEWRDRMVDETGPDGHVYVPSAIGKGSPCATCGEDEKEHEWW